MSFQEIKDYIHIIDQVVGNTPKQTEQVVVEDLTCKVNQHDDLNARVADLKSADTNLTKEENEKLQILLADQRGREKQVEQLEATRAQLFFCVCKITCMLDVVFVSLFVCFWLKAILSPYHVKFFWSGYGQKYPSYFKRTCRILLACVMREAQNVFVNYSTL